jgi:hypothetical protein
VKKMHKMCTLLNGTQAWKNSRLSEQTSPRGTSYSGKTVLFTRDKFPLGTATCYKTMHSERVCWNPKGWVRT